MKIFKKLCLFVFIGIVSVSCEDYLDVAPEVEIGDEDIFQEFRDFQGFVDNMYKDVVHISTFEQRNSWCWADDGAMAQRWIADARFDRGEYVSFVTKSNTSKWVPFYTRRYQGRNQAGYYENSWEGIRKANIALSRLDDLVGATQEERDLLEGQAYFFRAFFHFELMRFFGGLPYVDQLLLPSSDLKIPRLNYHETAEKVELDLNKAIELLPVNWDNTTVGNELAGGNSAGSFNDGRVTKGAAMGIKLMNLQYASSPLMNGSVTNSYTYNQDYAKRAADAAWQLLKLAQDTGEYNLEPWATYGDMFVKTNGDLVSRTELIWSAPMRDGVRTFRGYGPYLIKELGGGNTTSSPPANYVDLFETNTGYPIDDPESGFNPKKPWQNRDPRFDFNIRVDGEKQTIRSTGGNAPKDHIAKLYVGGRHRTSTNSITGFICEKWSPIGMNNKYDNNLNNTSLEVSYLRLSEVYLIYAEMVNEAYGPDGVAPGASLTAIQAINTIRSRAGQPDVPSKYTSNKELFRERIWNERNVELAFEHKRWFDIRRWFIAHLPKQKEEYELLFDKDHTYFTKRLIQTRVFDNKHYWFPFPNDQISLYPEFYQNPGW